MRCPDHYETDLRMFFDGKAAQLALYRALADAMEAVAPACAVKVQKTQISFYGRHLFAAVSLKRKRTWPDPCIVVTLGLGAPLDSPRVAVLTEPYPGRWTHHIPIGDAGEIDEELLVWIRAAWVFGETK